MQAGFKHTKLLPWLFILPTFLFLTMFTYYPAVKAFYMSFTASNLAHPAATFIGFRNYTHALKSTLFWKVLENNLWYSSVTVSLTLALGLFLAILVNRKLLGNAIYKAAFFYPNIIPMAAAAMVWLYIFLPGYGILDYMLSKIGLPNIEWVTSRPYAMWALIVVAIWKNAGYYMVIFLAGLQQIPNDLYEAATIDGASSWKKFTAITWPLLSPTTFFVSVIALINSFQAVDQIYLMTRGGPGNATNMFVYYIYQVAFCYWDLGYASALTVILLFLLLLWVSLFFIVLERKVFYFTETGS